MIEFTLDPEERGILEFEGAIWLSDNFREVERLILSDKGLYCVYSAGTDWAGNSKGESYRFNISDIVIHNGVAMVCQTKIRQIRCLQIQFKHGLEYLGFTEAAEMKTAELMKKINRLLGTQALEAPEEGTFSCYGCGAILPNGANYCFQCGRKTVKETKEKVTVEKNYYFAINGEAKGPFALEAVQQLLLSGQLKRNTLAWTKNMKDWVPMEQIPELKEIADSIPPSLR